MKIYADDIAKNCNNCAFRKIMSKHWDLEDYCSLNKKSICKINMDEDCPLEELEDKNSMKIFSVHSNVDREKLKKELEKLSGKTSTETGKCGSAIEMYCKVNKEKIMEDLAKLNK